MNTYSETFQNITQSVEQLLTNEYNSLEIKQSAISLRESVQPCIEEVKQSAATLKGLVQVGMDNLLHAEDVWNSKPRIAEAAKQEIWEQIGELSGRDIRIVQLGRQCRDRAVEKAKKSWDNRVERLKNKYFIDVKMQLKKGIHRGDKDSFIKDMRYVLENQFREVSLIIKQRLSIVHENINVIQLKSVQHYISLLDRQSKAKLSKQIQLMIRKIENKFGKQKEDLPDNIK